jgi:hypothetical protein
LDLLADVSIAKAISKLIATSVCGNQQCDNCRFFLQFSVLPYNFS